MGIAIATLEPSMWAARPWGWGGGGEMEWKEVGVGVAEAPLPRYPSPCRAQLGTAPSSSLRPTCPVVLTCTDNRGCCFILPSSAPEMLRGPAARAARAARAA